MKIDIGNRYIHAEPMKSPNSRPAYAIVNTQSDNDLGGIVWYQGWRQYVFRPNEGTEYNAGCLQSIVQFMEELK